MAHPWDFGWDALVAIGTLGLALATGALAWKTKNLADESSKEIAAGIRPVLMPAAGTSQDRPAVVTPAGVFVQIRNVGSGIALNVRADVDGVDAAEWDNSVLGLADQPHLAFERDETWEPGERWALDADHALTLRYCDLAGVEHMTVLPIAPVSGPGGKGVTAHRFGVAKISGGVSSPRRLAAWAYRARSLRGRLPHF